MSTLAQLRTAAPSAEILNEGWDYRIGENGTDAEMHFWVTGGELQALVNVVAGKPPTPVVIGGVSTTRMIPLQHPRDNTIYAYELHAYAPDGTASNEGPAGSGWGIDFEFYFVSVRFRSPKWSATGSYPMVSFDRESGSEMRTRPGTAYYFPSDQSRLLHDVGVPNLVTNFALNFEGLSSLNNALYDSMVGCVNTSAFYGYAAGTVLYQGCSSSGQYQIGGVPAFRARQQFQFSRVPHRQIMRPDGSAFEAPVQVGTSGSGSKYLIDDADLNQLYA